MGTLYEFAMHSFITAAAFVLVATVVVAQDVSNLGGSGCPEGSYDAGSVVEQGQDANSGGPNCQSCDELGPMHFGGKGRSKGNGNCEAECNECERPSPHPTYGTICWRTR